MYFLLSILFFHDFKDSSIKAFNSTNLSSLLLKCNVNHFLTFFAENYFLFILPLLECNSSQSVMLGLECLFGGKMKTKAKLISNPSKVASYSAWEILILVVLCICF